MRSWWYFILQSPTAFTSFVASVSLKICKECEIGEHAVEFDVKVLSYIYSRASSKTYFILRNNYPESIFLFYYTITKKKVFVNKFDIQYIYGNNL